MANKQKIVNLMKNQKIQMKWDIISYPKDRQKNFNLIMTSAAKNWEKARAWPGLVGVGKGTVTLESSWASPSNSETGPPHDKGSQVSGAMDKNMHRIPATTKPETMKMFTWLKMQKSTVICSLLTNKAQLQANEMNLQVLNYKAQEWIREE